MKKIFLIKINSVLKIYISLSLIFCIYSLLTITNEFPWMDEVMFIDPVASYLNTGVWTTNAWEGANSWYMPLYQMLMMGWISIFGFSFEVCRSLNLVFMFLLGLSCLKIMQLIFRSDLSKSTVILYTSLFWCFEELAWMSRNGRVDILGALIASLLIFSIVKSIFNSKLNTIAIIIYSTLLILSGIQAAVFIVALYFLFIILYKTHRRFILKSAAYTILGYGIGFSASCVFMYFIGNLKGFIMSFINMSATLHKIYYQYIRPAISNNEPIIISNEHNNILQNIIESYSSYSFIALLLLCLIVIIFLIKKRINPIRTNAPFILFLISLYIPVFMNFAGRFSEYYRWMCYIPTIMAITLWYASIEKRQIKLGIITVCMCICINGIVSLGKPGYNKDYKALENFIAKQPFHKDDRIETMWSTFYMIKPRVNDCYFYCRPQNNYSNNIDFILTPISHGEYVSRYFYEHEKALAEHLNILKADTTVQIQLIDELKTPNVKLYSVRKNIK